MKFIENWVSNFEVAKGKLGELIGNSYKFAGQKKTVVALDKLKELGFKEATKAGASIGVDDMIILTEKSQQIKSAQKEIDDVEKQYRKVSSSNRTLQQDH